MVLPGRIVDAATDGDAAVVEAWLNDAAPGSVNDRDEWGFTLLLCCMKSSIKERHVQFARMLIARGADVNVGTSGRRLRVVNGFAGSPGRSPSKRKVAMLLLLQY